MPLALEPCEINLEFFERHLQDGIANLHLSEQVVDVYLAIIIIIDMHDHGAKKLRAAPACFFSVLGTRPGGARDWA